MFVVLVVVLAWFSPWLWLSRRRYKLHAIGHCIFMDVKLGLLETALNATAGHGGGISTVTLSNFDASASASRGDVDPDDSECIFVQAFQSLRTVDADKLRGTSDSGQSKVFEVSCCVFVPSFVSLCVSLSLPFLLVSRWRLVICFAARCVVCLLFDCGRAGVRACGRVGV